MAATVNPKMAEVARDLRKRRDATTAENTYVYIQ